MTILMTSRELNQDLGRAKRAAKQGPVFITDRGRPAYVLMVIEDYQRLSGERRSLVDALAMAGLSDIDSVPPHIGTTGRLARSS